MSQQSRADIVIEWTIYAIRTFVTLPFSLQIVPFVSGKEAEAERLVIKVVEGENYLEADQGFNDVMTMTFKTTKRDEATVKDLWAKIDAALIAGLQTEGSNARAITIFSRLDFLTENATTELTSTTNFRHFSRTIPLHVLLLPV